MTLDARFLHWLQARDDELLYDEHEGLTHADAVVPRDACLHQDGRWEGWEVRARAITAENAALREEEPWPSR